MKLVKLLSLAFLGYGMENMVYGKCAKWGSCSKNMDLIAWMDVTKLGWPAGSECTSMSGWVDDRTSKKYIIQSCDLGHTVIDVTDPTNPVAIGKIGGENGGKFKWRDVKVYKDHAFMVSDALLSRMQVLDLKATVDGTNRIRKKERDLIDEEYRSEDETASDDVEVNEESPSLRGLKKKAPSNVPSLEAAAVYLGGGIYQSHNIEIDTDSGFAYAVGGGNNCENGAHMIDIRDPKNPKFAGCFVDKTSPFIHDAKCLTYTREHLGGKYAGKQICFTFHYFSVASWDVTDKKNVRMLSKLSYDGASYVHQGWHTTDRKFLMVDDERDLPGIGIKTFIIDIRELDDLKLSHVHTALGEVFGDHNQYVIPIGSFDYTFQANYAGGLRVLRIDRGDIDGVEQVVSLSEVGFFDPNNANHAQMEGVWSVYPFFTDENMVIVTDMETGFFIVRYDINDDTKAIPYKNGAPTPSPTSWSNCDRINDADECRSRIACKWDWDWQAVVGWKQSCSHQPGNPRPVQPYRAPPGGAAACSRLPIKNCNMYPACYLKGGCRAFPF